VGGGGGGGGGELGQIIISYVHGSSTEKPA
jgi:hypothetical protein